MLPDGAQRAFSFANAPPAPDQPLSTAGDVIELHVRLIAGGRFTLHDSECPILLLAGATAVQSPGLRELKGNV